MVAYQESESCQLACLGELLETHIGYKTGGRFVEVGAFDGYNWSNTWGLAKAGWQGIYIEANPEMCEKCSATHAKNKGIVVECVACGREIGRTRLYLGGSLSTILPETVGIYRSIPSLAFTGLSLDKYIDVDVMTLDALLDKHNWQPQFDVLVVDVEGAEYDVLCGFDLPRWLPKMAIIEAHEDFVPELARKALPIETYFSACGYTKVHHDTINSVYVR